MGTVATCVISGISPFGDGFVMIWGGLCFGSRTELVPFHTRFMNAAYYV